VPAMLLLLCLPSRRSWLTVEGARQGCCIAGADGQPWPCRSAWLVAFRTSSLGRVKRLAETAANSPEEKPRTSPSES
jgi:hypothetical protein